MYNIKKKIQCMQWDMKKDYEKNKIKEPVSDVDFQY